MRERNVQTIIQTVPSGADVGPKFNWEISYLGVSLGFTCGCIEISSKLVFVQLMFVGVCYLGLFKVY